MSPGCILTNTLYRYVNYLLFTILPLALVASNALAGAYTWVDENGVRHFSDRAPITSNQRVESIRVPEISTVTTRQIPPEALDFLDTTTRKPAKRKRVVMYSAEWCGVCKRAKGYFKQNNVRFTEKDIDKSPQAREEFKELGGRGVPLIVVGKQKMSGFSIGGFRKLYGDG